MPGVDVSGRSRPRPWTPQLGGKRAYKVAFGRTGARAKLPLHFESKVRFTEAEVSPHLKIWAARDRCSPSAQGQLCQSGGVDGSREKSNFFREPVSKTIPKADGFLGFDISKHPVAKMLLGT
jgi:hypothetical protein